MNESLNQIEKEAGAIVVRRNDEGVEVLLVTAKHDTSHWIFPKGHIDAGESPRQAAAREAREEAGVIVKAGQRIGATRYSFDHRDIEVEYFLCELESEQPAGEKRRIAWIGLEDVEERLSFDNLRELFRSARELIGDPGS